MYTFLHGCVLMCAREREREREREGVCFVSAGIYITEYHYFWCRKCMYIHIFAWVCVNVCKREREREREGGRMLCECWYIHYRVPLFLV